MLSTCLLHLLTTSARWGIMTCGKKVKKGHVICKVPRSACLGEDLPEQGEADDTQAAMAGLLLRERARGAASALAPKVLVCLSSLDLLGSSRVRCLDPRVGFDFRSGFFRQNRCMCACKSRSFGMILKSLAFNFVALQLATLPISAPVPWNWPQEDLQLIKGTELEQGMHPCPPTNTRKRK